ncbi:bacterial alpha-L-rhamnosidase domain protein [Trametes cingulata]|nr:bacterial alpha-L-rhamnosidase domain protein [Trametes cingulata]
MRLFYFACCVVAVAATVPYQQYILAPPSRTVRPVAVFRQHGAASSPDALLDSHLETNKQGLVLHGRNSSVIYDFGKNIAGLVNLGLSSDHGSVGVTFSESSLWVSSEASDATADVGLDSPLVFNITRAGHYQAPPKKERGGFRYLTVVNLGTDDVSLTDLWVHFTAMPHREVTGLRNYTGWFHSNDELLNRIWYAGAYTNQLATIDPKRGDALNHLDQLAPNASAPANVTNDWWLNTTITEGNSALTDGAKRDRLVWSGDMEIEIPSIAVSTFDLISIQNSLDSLFKLQDVSGALPFAGYPFNELLAPLHLFSFTYHLHALIGVANVYLWGGDKTFLDQKWTAWKHGMDWAVQQIDSTGLANITSPLDWAHFGLGGHSIEPNAILYHALNLGITLAKTEGDSVTAASYSELAARIQETAIPLLWQPSVGLFRDNETTTLAPQDGNAWAVKSGLVVKPSQIATISRALQARWGPYGAPAPEAGDTISPFASGFELQAHFLANRTDAALALIRRMWGFMLDDPRMTNSTFIEGYSVSGELHYPPYPNDARISHAHGWATGPTNVLTTYVGGIQLVGAAGATWVIAPQPGDLSEVDVGFSTTKGKFSSKWSNEGDQFRLSISTPRGTEGKVRIPLPGNHGKALLTGGPLKTAVVHGDASGRYWVEALRGGEYTFVAIGL